MAKEKKSQSKTKIARVKRVSALTIGVLAVSMAVAAAGFAGIVLGFSNRSLPFMSIGSIGVGNLSRDNLVAKIGALTPDQITVTAADQTITIKPSDIALAYDAEQTADAIIGVTDPENLLQLAPLKEQKIIVTFDEGKLNSILDSLAKKVNHDAKQASVEFKKNTLVVHAETASGREIDEKNVRKTIVTQFSQFDFSPVTATVTTVEPLVTGEMINASLNDLTTFLTKGLTLTVGDQQFKIEKAQLLTLLKLAPDGTQAVFRPNEDTITAYVKTLAKQTDQVVKDASLKMVDGKVQVFQASQQGRVMDKDNAVAAIVDALNSDNRAVTLPVTTTDPKVTTASVNDLGIQELIGTATTNFRNSPENRKHNIANGAAKLNGVLVAPDQVFSTIDTLGNPDEASGYLPELVIKENHTIPEFGGGLCQVSTTLFRAAMNTGLPIVERQNHSWRISYYEPPVGLDATVYYPSPDFKFKNNTPGWVLIQSRIEGTTITFDIFGTKDGRRSEVSSELVSTSSPPDTVYANSDTIPQGTTKQIEKAHPGGKAIAHYKVFDKDGKVVNDQTFPSTYKAVPAQFLVGTGTPPPPAPADQSTQSSDSSSSAPQQ